MKNKAGETCPRCGAGVKYPGRPRNLYPDDNYTLPTTFMCGTVTSPNWSPSVFDRNCKAPAGVRLPLAGTLVKVSGLKNKGI